MQAVEQIPSWAEQDQSFPPLGEDPVIHETAVIRNTKVGSYVEIGPWAELVEVEVGNYSYIAGVHSALFNTVVGKFTSIASSVRINPVAHPMERPTQHHCTYRRRQYGFDMKDDEHVFSQRRAKRCLIGHDVWIGHGAIVMGGVTIGTGAVIGSGAVVTKDVDPYSVVVGNPARPLRKRFDEPVIKHLLASAWWDWPHDKLQREFPRLLDLKRFLKEDL